jgi:nitrogen regulatory protein P-II 1
MKEIKAYVRDSEIAEIVQAMESSGVSGMTITHVQAILDWADPDHFKYSLDTITKYTKVVKLELVCKDADVSRLIDVIKTHAHTGRSGDGMIFVTDVKEAVKIKTGATGEKALE